MRLSKKYQVHNLSLKTLYFGGGSPAVLSVEEMADILETVHNCFTCELDEFTLEMNPHQVKRDYVWQIKNLGVNRISLGVQSFHQAYLNDIGRKAKADKGREAFYILREEGVDNISLDLIYGGPKTSVQSVKEDLDEFIKLNPEHISTYCLSVDSDCKLDKRLQSGLVSLPDDESIADQMEFITDYLPKVGYNRYEISNYAKAGFESRHNLSYWEYKDSLGAGSAAVYTFQEERVENYADIERYISLAEAGDFPLGDVYVLDSYEKFMEYLMMGLRLKKGIILSECQEKYGFDVRIECKDWINKYQKMGLMALEEDNLRLTDRALNVSNAILSELF